MKRKTDVEIIRHSGYGKREIILVCPGCGKETVKRIKPEISGGLIYQKYDYSVNQECECGCIFRAVNIEKVRLRTKESVANFAFACGVCLFISSIFALAVAIKTPDVVSITVPAIMFIGFILSFVVFSLCQ